MSETLAEIRGILREFREGNSGVASPNDHTHAIDIRIPGRGAWSRTGAALALARAVSDIIRRLISFISMSVPCGIGGIRKPNENREDAMVAATETRTCATGRRHRALMLWDTCRADWARVRFAKGTADLISGGTESRDEAGAITNHRRLSLLPPVAHAIVLAWVGRTAAAAPFARRRKMPLLGAIGADLLTISRHSRSDCIAPFAA